MKRKKAEQIEMFAAPAPAPVQAKPVVRDLTPQAERLLANFDVLAEAEGGVARLRELILGLAVRGKLVGQDPGDECAAYLVERAQNERADLVSLGKLRNLKPLERNQLAELGLLPIGWISAALDEISIKITDGEHATPKRENLGHYLLSARNIRDGFIDVSDVDYVGSEEFERIRQRCDPDAGDILLSCSGSIGRVAVVDANKKYAMVRSAALIKHSKSNVDSQYLAIALRSPILRRQMESKAKQSAQPNLFIEPIRHLVVPLPPLAEQKRIVAKVDELMKLCDELEARQAKERETGTRLTKAALDALATAEGPAEVAAAWERVVGNFEGLISRADDVKKVRETVLSLAVRGRLVEDDKQDAPAAMCVSYIEDKPSSRARTGHGKSDDVNEVDLAPYSIPARWAWISLGQVTRIKTGKLDANASSPNGQYPFFTCARDPLRIDRYGYDCECVLLAGNGNFDVNYYKGKFEAYQRTYIIESIDPNLMDVRYLHRFMQLYADTLREKSVGGVISYIKIGFLTDAPFPLPPLAEQKRIVAKVDQLMALCDALEARLREAEATSRKVAEALVAEVVQG